MIFWNTRRVNKLRKSQRCEYCDRRLEPGTSAMYHSGLFGGEFISYYLCDWCDNHIAEIEAPDGGSYEFKSGGLWNAVINGHCDIKCPQCGETELEVKDYNTISIHAPTRGATAIYRYD